MKGKNHRLHIQGQRLRRQRHVRKKLHGTTERPRLAVFRSSKHIYAQVINDDEAKTLVSAGTIEADFRQRARLRRQQGRRRGRRQADRRAGQGRRY